MVSQNANRSRLNDWESRLNRVIKDWMGKRFLWGHTDCFHYAGAITESITGCNPCKEYIGSYSTKLSAKEKLMEVLGPANDHHIFLEWWASQLGRQVTAAVNLIKGDLVVQERDGFYIHGMVIKRGLFITKNFKSGKFAPHNLHVDDLGVAL